jgi:hypothetical protein
VALQGAIPIEFATFFPNGAYAAGGVEPVRDFEASKASAGRFVQQRDKDSGLPMWQIEVIDADPEARTRTIKVKVIADVQPVPPAPTAGMPFTPVEFTGMLVRPYVDEKTNRLLYSLRSTGIRAPGGRPAGRPGQDGKEQGQ